ncbi:hypothetical protein [Haloarcula japonica]|uniref:hypothetical protein n=1 Tax=Haloarcula japonica TaxID=29282 RepID=UPI001EF9E83F|nr:hypothetical protein [Haloarcula japonica]
MSGPAILACDQPTDARLLRWSNETERINERLPLVLAHNSAERSPDVTPCRVVWVVAKVGVNGVGQLVVFRPRCDWWVRTDGRRVIAHR